MGYNPHRDLAIRKGKDMNNQSIDIVLRQIAEIREELRDRFTVSRIGVFGSVARGDARPESDVDILVEMDEAIFDHYLAKGPGTSMIQNHE